MIRRRAGQLSLADAVMFGAAIPDVRMLMDPTLRRVDELLSDDELIDVVLDRQRKRFAQSKRRGRYGTPAEVVLRMLVLKHLKQWSYEQLEWEVTGNLVYRYFCRIGSHKVPDSKTMVRQGKLLDGDSLRGVFERIVEQAVERKVSRGRKMRIDTTVVETPIRYPSDSRLCEDVTGVLSREMERVRSEGMTVPSTFRNVRRSVGRRCREITAISRKRVKPEQRRAALKKPYGRLLNITRRVIRQAQETLENVRRKKKKLHGHIKRCLRTIKQTIDLGQRVVRQTKRRIFHGITNEREKIVSIFEPHTKILRRGKIHKPTEFGVMVRVQESEAGIVTDIGVTNEHDTALLIPAVKHHYDVFHRVPHTVATDRGFYSTDNIRKVESMNVKVAAVPKPGFRSPARLQKERARPFRKARAWRAGGEAKIARLKHTFGMHRSRYRGRDGPERCVLWAGIANNLVAIARS